MLEQRGFSCRIYQTDGGVRVIRPVCETNGVELAGTAPRRADAVPVTSIMTRDVICAQRSIAVDRLVPLMIKNHIGSIPVVDDRGKPVGMITKLDLIQQLSRLDGRTAEDVMMPLAMSLDERASIAQAAGMMAAEDVHHVPVVAGSGAIMGIVSSLDIVRWLATNEAV